MTSLISSLPFKSTGESTSDTFYRLLSQMRKEVGDWVTYLPKGRKVSLELGWRCTHLLQDQLGAQSWGQKSSSWLQTRGHNNGSESVSQEGACSEH